MRDKVRLQTLMILPRDYEGKKFAAIVDRSPYGYTDLEWIADIFVPFGFVAVGQDMRGTALSGGNFTMWQSDANDSEDLGNWIVAQEWSNGQIFTLGASADGIGSLQTPRNNPSWLAAQYIIWAPAVMYDILFPYGTYKQETTESWLNDLTMRNEAVKIDNIRTVYENEAHTDYWRQIESSAEVYKNVRATNAFWGGWYDLFITGTLAAFEGYNTQSDPSVRYTSKITIDPLGHCLDFPNFFTEDVVEGRTGLVLAQMFETYGIRPVSRNGIKNITFYVMSSDDEAGRAAGQFWTSVEKWPTPRMTDFYLHSDKTAQRSPPLPGSGAVSTSYIHDPANPVPTLGGNNLCPDIGGTIACGPQDQNPADSRSDVLVFQTEPQAEPLYLTGPMFANLFVSSDAIDTDFMVKISDVYPTGEARLIMDNAIRMRWRHGGLLPLYMNKGEVYEVNINVWNTSWVVAPGHALRFTVSSSNWPRFAVNPNNGVLLKDPAYPGNNITAKNVLFHSAKYPSKFILPVVNKIQIPEVHVLKEVQTAYPHVTNEMVAKFAQVLERKMKLKGAK
jgi:hypothetical protein